MLLLSCALVVSLQFDSGNYHRVARELRARCDLGRRVKQLPRNSEVPVKRSYGRDFYRAVIVPAASAGS